ncbi:MAG: hypothetical protein HY698_09190, partial [Deltaproteobacteria bacterium]|nr:hypothetical protein [Deltaproteobacteria bacterium]
GHDITARAREWNVVYPWTGTIQFVNTTMKLFLNEDFTAGIMEAGMIWTTCGLSRALFPGATGGSILDFAVSVLGVEADMDLDHDGLEKVKGDPAKGVVSECIDGDGKTRIVGPDCACDPRIADGFSVALRADLVLAYIDGVTTLPP